MPSTLTTGAISKETGIPVWQILAAIRRGFLDEPERVGHFRVWQRSDLPRIQDALRAAGYLRDSEAARAS